MCNVPAMTFDLWLCRPLLVQGNIAWGYNSASNRSEKGGQKGGGPRAKGGATGQEEALQGPPVGSWGAGTYEGGGGGGGGGFTEVV